MATLVENYRPEVFGAVPLLHDAVQAVSFVDFEKILKETGKLFLKHDVQDKYALVLVHRHFDLQDNEILVESATTDGKSIISIPWKFNGTKIEEPVDPAYMDSLNICTGKFVTPQTWAFSDQGELNPFEFQYCSESTALDSGIFPPSNFVNDLFEHLKGLGLEKSVGLGLKSSKVGWESTDMDNRTNVVKFARGNAANMMCVQWAFNSDGTYIENGFCVYIEVNGRRIHRQL